MWIAILSSLFCIAGLVTLQWLRIRKIPKEFDLQHNCLMTRSPLLLLNGPQSLFYFGRYWNSIPTALYEHGYEIYVWQAKTRKTWQRAQELEQFLQIAKQQKLQFHLLADSSNMELLERLARNSHPAIASLNLVHSQTQPPERKSTDLKPAQTPIVEWPMATLSLRWIERVQNWAHNFVVGAEKSMDLSLLSTSTIKNWLEIAISLAETEMKWSHEDHGNIIDTTHP